MTQTIAQFYASFTLFRLGSIAARAPIQQHRSLYCLSIEKTQFSA